MFFQTPNLESVLAVEIPGWFELISHPDRLCSPGGRDLTSWVSFSTGVKWESEPGKPEQAVSSPWIHNCMDLKPQVYEVAYNEDTFGNNNLRVCEIGCMHTVMVILFAFPFLNFYFEIMEKVGKIEFPHSLHLDMPNTYISHICFIVIFSVSTHTQIHTHNFFPKPSESKL